MTHLHAFFYTVGIIGLGALVAFLAGIVEAFLILWAEDKPRRGRRPIY
jgi:hypothetical protein